MWREFSWVSQVFFFRRLCTPCWELRAKRKASMMLWLHNKRLSECKMQDQENREDFSSCLFVGCFVKLPRMQRRIHRHERVITPGNTVESHLKFRFISPPKRMYLESLSRYFQCVNLHLFWLHLIKNDQSFTCLLWDTKLLNRQGINTSRQNSQEDFSPCDFFDYVTKRLQKWWESLCFLSFRSNDKNREKICLFSLISHDRISSITSTVTGILKTSIRAVNSTWSWCRFKLF